MRRKETQKISDVLKVAIKQSVYEHKLLETRIIENWSKLLGPGIGQATSQIYIRNKTLIVHIDSSVIKHELFMMRTRILQALNESVKSEVINNIHFA